MSETIKQTVFPMKYKQIGFFTRTMILQRDNHTCQRCLTKMAGKKLDVHHKIPVRKGGTDTTDNLVTLCKPCHRKIEPIKILRYAYRVTNYAFLGLDKETSRKLGLLADVESRTKIDELRFLVKERAKELGVKLK